MKKIGVVTWASGVNFGTGLQAFALMHVLERLGYGPVLLSKRYAEPDLANYIISLGRILGVYEYWENFKIKHILKKDIISYKPTRKTADWNRKNIKSVNVWFPFQYRKFVEKIDCFVTGSDQIWNSYVGFDKDMYLAFAGDKKKIAYSSSIGTATINPTRAEQIKALLLPFAHIGVREETGAVALRNLTGRSDIRQVLDPTLLLNKNEWRDIASRANPPVDMSSKYIVCYLLGRHTSYHEQLKHVRQSTGINRVVVIPANENREFRPDEAEVYTKSDPFEFVKLIENSSFVCTDSFHATAFSINLQKPFVEFLRFDHADKESQNSRIYDIIAHYGLQSRMYNKNSEEWALPIDFIKPTSKLEEDRIDSLEFLKNAIEH